MSQAEQSIRDNLEQVFSLPADAVDYLCDLFSAIQLFDDVADKDPVSRPDLDCVIWRVFVKIPQNPFYVRNSFQLSALLSTQILKWQASDKVERSGEADEKSFMWRAGFYDVVLFVVGLCHGREVATKHAADVLGLYGENASNYMKEFNHA